MKMLVIEDRGLVLEQIGGILEYEKINTLVDIIPCCNINQAEEEINMHKSDIRLICADLSMDPLGFTDEECYKTEGGILTGWVWLKKIVFSNPELIKTQIIIFTDYINSLEAYIRTNQSEQTLYNRTTPISKGMKDGNIGYENLVQTIKKMLNSGRSN